MRQLNKPTTSQRLGQLFGASEATRQQPPRRPFVLDSAKTLEQPTEMDQRTLPRDASLGSKEASDALALVQDNTYFRPKEAEAWFGFFERLQQMDEQQLRELTLGELTYTQLLKQPQVYRGQVVTIRGTLRREELEQSPENSLGIESTHRLVIQPRGGGHWPMVVHCLELPENFPHGEDPKTPVSVTGFFFKNWSYAWQGGLGIAPTLLARSIDWQPVVVQPVRRTVSSAGLTKILSAAFAFAVVAVLLIIRNTRRPPRVSPASKSITFPEESSVETVHEQLQKLAETEHGE